MKDILSMIYTSVKQNNIKAFNYAKTKNDAVCFNLLEIPDTPCTIVTISVIKNRKRIAGLDFVSFAKLMSEVENRFFELGAVFGYNSPHYFVPLANKVDNSWYRTLDCHRLFVIPTDCVFSALETLTDDNLERILDFKCGIHELSFYVNTNKHNLKLTRFHNKEVN